MRAGAARATAAAGLVAVLVHGGVLGATGACRRRPPPSSSRRDAGRPCPRRRRPPDASWRAGATGGALVALRLHLGVVAMHPRPTRRPRRGAGSRPSRPALGRRRRSVRSRTVKADRDSRGPGRTAEPRISLRSWSSSLGPAARPGSSEVRSAGRELQTVNGGGRGERGAAAGEARPQRPSLASVATPGGAAGRRRASTPASESGAAIAVVSS